MSETSKFHFKSLDAIRTIAFFSTFLAHSFRTENSAILNSTLFKAIDYIKETIGFGVPIFFVLSGFLITYLILKDQEKERFTIKNFYIKRVLRIWPVYFAVVIFGFFIFPLIRSLVLHQPTTENAHFLMYLFFLSNLDQIFNGQLPFGVGLGPTWSVSIEEQYYLFWPILLFFLPKRSFVKGILSVLVVTTILALIFNLPHTHSITSMIYLSMGSLFGYMSYYNYKNINTKIAQSGFVVILLILVSTVSIYNSHFLPYPIKIIVFSFGIGMFILFQIYSPNWSLSKIKILEDNGKYTYGLYLYHSIAIFVVYTLFKSVLHVQETILSVIVVIPVLSLALSYLFARISYKYFESYFLSLKSKY